MTFGAGSSPTSVIEGMVLFVHTDLVNPAKNKYLIVASISSDKQHVGLVVVGSNPSPFAVKNPAVRDRQWVLPKDQRNLVALYDSYANCADLKTKPMSEVQAWLVSKPRACKGHLTGRELHLVKDLLRSAPTINQALKTLVGL